MDFTTLQLTEQVILEKAQSGELFTAYDVTKEVRRRVGRGTNIPHNDVKQEVHTFFATGQMGTDYTRTLANLPGVNPQPWIYHRTTDDPNTYGGNLLPAPVVIAGAGRDDTTDDGVNVTADGVNATDDGVNVTADGVYKVDARETLCLPKSLLQDAGLVSGDTAQVYANPLAGTLIVAKQSDNLLYTPTLSTYKVDMYGNVRVTQHTLQRAGCGGKEYKIEGDTTKLVVTKLS
jgi:hypothetical protein